MSFECDECKKTYTSQSSLNRHRQNHSTSRQYPCSVCNVIFYRADLRTRHMRLHQSSDSAATATSVMSGEASTPKQRRRCHTACARCRGLRIKCNSPWPCNACKANDEPCVSARDTHRVSHARSRPGANVSQAQNESFAQLSPPDSHSEVRLAPRGASAAASTDMDSGPQRVVDTEHHDTGCGSIDISHNNPPFFVPEDAFHDRLAQDAPIEPDSFLQQTQQEGSVYDISWPWVYEDLFLPFDDATLWPQMSLADTSDAQRRHHSCLPQSRDQGLEFGTQNWEDQAVDHSYSHVASGPGRLSRPSMSTHFPSAAGSSIPQSQLFQPREAAKLAQAQEISTLISYAVDKVSQPKSDHNSFWQTMSPKVAVTFDFSSLASSNVLEEFVHHYLDHFGLLWPLLSRQNLDLGSLHPLLYLVLTSIGAMYGTAAQSTYGSMMHTAIRKTLMLPLEFGEGDDDFLWLAQARLLTQVAALYFGQPKAFSYAQHLGCLLVAQARRLDLFAPVHGANGFEHDNNIEERRTPRDRLDGWLQREARRRLAFGIFRGDTYTSVLLGIKTLVSPEEIDLELPTCDLVWLGDCVDPSTCLLLIEQDRSLGRHLRFSDIYRIAMDQSESLPALEPPSYELLLFALQGPLWRFSRDPKMFERLTGHERDYTRFEGNSIDEPSQGMRQSSRADVEAPFRVETAVFLLPSDHLNESRRQMADLKNEAGKLMFALHKWKQSLSLVRTTVRSDRERGSLLSSLLLYHTSYIRLHAPMEELHRMEHKLAEGRTVSNSIRHRVRQWAHTSSAYVAAQHASHVWELITKEKEMPENIRAKFNLIAFTGLHHAATVLWSYAGAAQDTTGQDSASARKSVLELHSRDPAQPSIRVCRSETKALLNSFAQLYSVISPAHWSAFAKVAEKLSEFQFPLPAE